MFNKYHVHRASISMSNVVVDPSYLNIACMPDELKQLALEKIANIPAETIWPAGSYHAEEHEYQTGIEAIRDGLQRERPANADQQWKWFLQYTADLDRLRGTDTLKYIPEIKEYVEKS